MAIAFSPTKQDVNRYRRLRTLGTELIQDVSRTVPQRVWRDIRKAILVSEFNISENEYLQNVVADCCIYDSIEDGKNILQRYSEVHPGTPGTDERYVLDAYLRAEYRILLLESAIPGAGIHCRDARSREELFLMDLSFSRSRDFFDLVMASRLVPFENYWMTTSAALLVAPPPDLPAKLQQLEQLGAWDPLRFVRTFVAAGGADMMRHDDTGMKPRKQDRGVPAIDPTDLCTCRSGLMYKYCCGRINPANTTGR